MTYAEIRAVLTDYFTAALIKLKSRAETNGRLSQDRKANIIEAIAQANTDIATNNYYGSEFSAVDFIADNRLPIQVGTPAFEMFTAEYTRARRDYFTEVLRFDNSLDAYSFDLDIQPPVKVVKPSKHRITDELDNYIEYAVRTKQWATKTAKENRSFLDTLVEFFGEDVSFNLNSDAAYKLQLALLNLPKHRSLKPQFKGMSVAQLAALPSNHPGKKDNLLTNASINKHMVAYNSFFEWALKRQYASENSFKNMLLPEDKDKIDRVPFSDTQLRLIFDAIAVESKLEYRWGIRIARFTGARLEEIAQLHNADIQEIDNVWCFKFNDEGENKSIKTKAGNRIVPIHSKLIELGLLDYHAEVSRLGKERLLHQLTYSAGNGYGRNLGRWFNNSLLNRKLDIKEPNLVFHCFRHTVATELVQASVDRAVIRDLIGHEQQDTLHKVYARTHSVAQLKDTVELLAAG